MEQRNVKNIIRCLFMVVVGSCCVLVGLKTFPENTLAVRTKFIRVIELVSAKYPAGVRESFSFVSESAISSQSDYSYTIQIMRRDPAYGFEVFPLGSIGTQSLFLSLVKIEPMGSVQIELLLFEQRSGKFEVVSPARIHVPISALHRNAIRSIVVHCVPSHHEVLLSIQNVLYATYTFSRDVLLQSSMVIPQIDERLRDTRIALFDHRTIYRIERECEGKREAVVYVPGYYSAQYFRYVVYGLYGMGIILFAGCMRMLSWKYSVLMLMFIMAVHECGLRWGGKEYCNIDRALYNAWIVRDMKIMAKVREHLKDKTSVQLYNGDDVGVNERPFIPVEKKKGVTRIICVGSSPVLLLYGDETQSFPNVLGDILSEHFPGRYEVFNAGIPQISPDAVTMLYREIVKVLDPDIVILYFPRDGLKAAFPYRDTDNILEKYHTNKDNPNRLHAVLQFHHAQPLFVTAYTYASFSYFFNAVEYVRHIILSSIGKMNPLNNRQDEEYDMRRHFAVYQRIHQASYHDLVVIPQNYKQIVNTVFDRIFTEETIIELERKRIFIMKGISEEIQRRPWVFFNEGSHFSPTGHDMIARYLFDFMVNKGLVSKGSQTRESI